jgi:hypothetical protein
VVADLHHFDEELHQSKKSDPDPHPSEQRKPDPHQSDLNP